MSMILLEPRDLLEAYSCPFLCFFHSLYSDSTHICTIPSLDLREELIDSITPRDISARDHSVVDWRKCVAVRIPRRPPSLFTSCIFFSLASVQVSLRMGNNLRMKDIPKIRLFIAYAELMHFQPNHYLAVGIFLNTHSWVCRAYAPPMPRLLR